MGVFARNMLAAALVLAFVNGAGAQTAAAPARTYEQWVAMAEAGDPATDFTPLRMTYMQSPGYDGYGMKSESDRQELVRASNAQDCPKGLSSSEALLKIDYTYPLAHLIRANCFHKQGDIERAEREYAIFEGLKSSLMGSGDGKAPATAFVVVTMSEERFVLILLNLDEQMQALVMESGHNYDRIDAVDTTTGEKKSVYFNVDAMFGSLTRKFGGSQQEQEN
jgi:hypothetical protein